MLIVLNCKREHINPLDPKNPNSDAVALPAPTNFKAIGQLGYIRLTWYEVQDANSYKIYKDGLKFTTVDLESCSDYNVETGITYSYQVAPIHYTGLEGFRSKPEKASCFIADDTIYYDNGNVAGGWYDEDFWGVRFTPVKDFFLVSALIRIDSTSSDSCVLYIYEDSVCNPGRLIESDSFIAVEGWNEIKLRDYFSINNDFWLCFYVPAVYGGPYISGDASGGWRSYFSSNGITWENIAESGYSSDLFIRAVGHYME